MSIEWTTIGDCRLACGDSLEILPTLDTIDHCLTDPPYSDAVKAGARTRNDDEFGGDSLVPFSIDETTLEAIFDEVGPLIRRWFVASVDFKHGGRLAIPKPVGLLPAGMRWMRAACWVKTNSAPQFTGDRPAPGWEFIAIMHNEGIKPRWNGGGKRGVWTTSIQSANGHPTPKPVELMLDWVTDFTDEGETILDPFCGSGTTGIACVQTGRKFVGIEREPKYFDIACKRIETAVRDAKCDLFKHEKPQTERQGSLL